MTIPLFQHEMLITNDPVFEIFFKLAIALHIKKNVPEVQRTLGYASFATLVCRQTWNCQLQR